VYIACVNLQRTRSDLSMFRWQRCHNLACNDAAPQGLDQIVSSSERPWHANGDCSGTESVHSSVCPSVCPSGRGSTGTCSCPVASRCHGRLTITSTLTSTGRRHVGRVLQPRGGRRNLPIRCRSPAESPTPTIPQIRHRRPRTC